MLKTRLKTWMFITAMLPLLVVAGVACGGADDGRETSHGMDPAMDDTAAAAASPKPDHVIDLTLEQVRFAPDNILIPYGRIVQINMRNMDGAEHDFQVDGVRVELLGDSGMRGHHAGAGAAMLAMHTGPNRHASAMFRTEHRGTFEFYCTIPGHRDAGMRGTLIVS